MRHLRTVSWSKKIVSFYEESKSNLESTLINKCLKLKIKQNYHYANYLIM